MFQIKIVVTNWITKKKKIIIKFLVKLSLGGWFYAKIMSCSNFHFDCKIKIIFYDIRYVAYQIHGTDNRKLNLIFTKRKTIPICLSILIFDVFLKLFFFSNAVIIIHVTGATSHQQNGGKNQQQTRRPPLSSDSQADSAAQKRTSSMSSTAMLFFTAVAILVVMPIHIII